ncbi:tRNA (adenosine(37)-N6)-threonylcarbamoyltransferase complex ATPase subunit type 1 TsaE [Pseudooctadecabacter sp.]|uniref:tRNA (adenosine(37)-N6)-threonylcarbamoyltransferase complex ATPase subunit type 1 TsaE n=1 Tax=Pseudooctadecabacter sp. TaxID=1966338 RepID=UPI0035C8371B
MTSGPITISLPDAAATDRLGAALAGIAKFGDCILLSGQIGAGKSAIARAFIRALLGPETDVPSPTFTLVQTYVHSDFEIWHADLYRLSDTQEAVELGLTDAFDTAVTLIEWPDLLENLAPAQALRIHLTVQDVSHVAQISYGPDWSDRIAQVISDAK